MTGVIIKVTFIVAVITIFSSLIDSSAGCLQTDSKIDPDKLWACWRNTDSALSSYQSRNLCCKGLYCQCNEEKNNPRFGKDCECSTRNRALEDYWAEIIEKQKQHSAGGR